MGTSRETIKSWLKKGMENNALYVLVYCDTYDWGDYPVYAYSIEGFWKEHDNPQHQLSNMQRLMEVYDLSMDIEKQLDERRATHFPPK